MATFTAVKDGNWSAADTWDVGSGYPGEGDDVVIPTYSVSLDVAGSCKSLTGSGSGKLNIDIETSLTVAETIQATISSGSFINIGNVGGLVSIVASLILGNGGSNNVFTVYTVNSGITNITANITAVNGVAFLSGTSVGVINIYGNVTGGSSTSCYGVRNNSSGTVNIYGNVTGGSGSSSYGVYATSNASKVNIYGNVTGGSGSSSYGVGISNTTNVVVTIVGTVVGGSTTNTWGAANISSADSCILTIYGDVYGGSYYSAQGAYAYTKTSTVVICGNCYCGVDGVQAFPFGGGAVVLDFTESNFVQINGNTDQRLYPAKRQMVYGRNRR